MTIVIGIGNLDRGDDAAGLAVARLLREKLAAARAGQNGRAPRVTVRELDGDQLALLDAWDDDGDVRVVDATCSDATPGTVCRFDGAGPLNSSFQHRGTHTFSLADVIELARALGRLPAHLTGYGIEGKSFLTGDPMSAEVRAAVTEVTCELLHELKAGGLPMCLGIVGMITEIREDEGIPMALVAARPPGPQGDAATLAACLLTCPEARVGQMVLVHSGYVLQTLDGEDQS